MKISKSARSFFFFFPLLFSFTHVGAEENFSRMPIHLLELSAGDIGLDDDVEEPNIIGIDYRMLPFSKWDLIPVIGIVYKKGGASYTYFDLRYDYWISDHWVLVPSYGVGYYNEDDEIDLGGQVEFRAGIGINRRFNNGFRLGLVFFHLSNGKIYSSNPGTEALAVSLSIPLNG